MTKPNHKEVLNVVELFAGVGGFRLGLEGYKGNRNSYHKQYKTVWFNQWEPGSNVQHAHKTYVNRFGDFGPETNMDIATVIDKVPDHDLLVGGFPCQDYSVARTLSHAQGIVGKKGVLWWSIYEVLKSKGDASPAYLMFENVDRLLNSPATQRGRDFAIMLSTLNMLDYVVEWRIINAADYGMPQRRRRIFILGYKKDTPIYKEFQRTGSPEKWLIDCGVIQSVFPIVKPKQNLPVQTDLFSDMQQPDFDISLDPKIVSDGFNINNPSKSLFKNSGVAIDGKVYTRKVTPINNSEIETLGSIMLPEEEIPPEFYIDEDQLDRWVALKGAKKDERTAKNGYKFFYTEGAVAFPDPLNKPSRTIITGEGGPTPSRFKHVIETKSGRLRRLTPEELEMLCMFPIGHTALDGNTPNKRAFFMGNALVVGVVDKLGKALIESHNKMK